MKKLMDEARCHVVSLEQCSIFARDVGEHIAKSMTDAAEFLKKNFVDTPKPEDLPYKWYYTWDREHYYGPYDTKEEAIQAARTEEAGWEDKDGVFSLHYWVAECQNHNIRLANYFSAEDFLIKVDENDLQDLGNEGDSVLEEVNITPEQEKSLEHAVKFAIEKWQVENNIHIHPYMFRDTRNLEKIEEIVNTEESPLTYSPFNPGEK